MRNANLLNQTPGGATQTQEHVTILRAFAQQAMTQLAKKLTTFHTLAPRGYAE